MYIVSTVIDGEMFNLSKTEDRVQANRIYNEIKKYKTAIIWKNGRIFKCSVPKLYFVVSYHERLENPFSVEGDQKMETNPMVSCFSLSRNGAIRKINKAPTYRYCYVVEYTGNYNLIYVTERGV